MARPQGVVDWQSLGILGRGVNFVAGCQGQGPPWQKVLLAGFPMSGPALRSGRAAERERRARALEGRPTQSGAQCIL
jgi:hypothetical protein